MRKNKLTHLLEPSLRLYFVINIERMYQKVASYIKVGQNGCSAWQWR